MKYILIWKVDKTVPTECPDYVPDPYTGEYPSFHCDVYHFKTITEERSKGFATKKEALDFASKAPSQCYAFSLNGKDITDKRDKKENNITISTAISTESITLSGTATLALDGDISWSLQNPIPEKEI